MSNYTSQQGKVSIVDLYYKTLFNLSTIFLYTLAKRILFSSLVFLMFGLIDLSF